MVDLELDEALAVMDGLTEVDRCSGCGERSINFFCRQRTDHGTYSFCAACVKAFQMNHGLSTTDSAGRVLRFCGFQRFFERNGSGYDQFLKKTKTLRNIEHMMTDSKEFRGQWLN